MGAAADFVWYCFLVLGLVLLYCNCSWHSTLHRPPLLPTLPAFFISQLRRIDRVRIYGPSPEAAQGRAALATFNVEGIHPTDISTILDTVRVLPIALCWLA